MNADNMIAAPQPQEDPAAEMERPAMEIDIACAGFGPAMGGFLTTLTRAWSENPGDPCFESKAVPGMPLQVLCYERADDIASGVSGVVTSAQGIRASFPHLNPTEIPMAVEVSQERVLYLLDPIGASRRSFALRAADTALHAVDVALRTIDETFGTPRSPLRLRDHAFELPWTPAFLRKDGGLILSIGQLNQWVGTQIVGAGLAQIWVGTPVTAPLFEKRPSGTAVKGLRLADQGVDHKGAPTDSFMLGMDIHAKLTAVADGPVGAVSQAIDKQLGLPEGHAHREWALGMKFVIEIPEDSPLKPGTVWHTFGFPEPEIFGFLYVHPDRLVSVGIFVPSWMSDPQRTGYRYLQHYIQHPALWPYFKDGTLRSWGAKSIEESGKRGEPFLSGDGYARIGESSGSTNMLTGSGVDEAWTTGVQLGEAVLELLRAGKSFTKENLAATYEARRLASWVERGAQQAANARNGFQGGLLRGLAGMALAALSKGKLSMAARIPPAYQQIRTGSRDVSKKNEPLLTIDSGRPRHETMLSARGWPEIAFDGRLLVSQQDALILGGKVQAMPGFADHVVVRDAEICNHCVEKTCISMCSGQALTEGPTGVPAFEREKCVHCGACLWNCAHSPDGEHGNIEFRAGAGGLHSAEN
jgi:electron-transferring-flavoprotein dehydrogenase